MKNVIIVVILGVAGYFAYDYFIGSAPTGSNRTGNYSVFLPEQCVSSGESFANAVHNNEIAAKVNGFRKAFRSCLRGAGYSESEIDEACDNIVAGR